KAETWFQKASSMASHSSDWVTPIGIDYRGVRSISHPPNSVGVVALQTLGMLDRFEAPAAGSFDGSGWADSRWVHLGLEASRMALAERDAHVTDPASMPADTVAEMLSDELIDVLASRLDAHQVRASRPSSSPPGGGTVYLTTADRWGGLVSLLQSNYQGFGSGLVDPATGIGFQDRGAFFSLDPEHPNALAPSKRTAHTLAPGMLLRDGRPWIAHGAMGGEIQPQVFAQFVSAVIDGRADVATAVAAPRWAAQMREQHGPPSLTAVESRLHPDVIAALREMGHEVEVREAWSSAMGHAHAIEVLRDDDGAVLSFAAGADPRTEGQAAAF
ncbi:MAG: gamma-glutamyltransferase, partial [Chloroflexota bacterium]